MKDTIMKLLLLTGCAGFPGTMLRYTCVRAPEHVSGGFPWGTLPVNAIGAFAAGFLFVYCRERFAAYQEYFPIVFPGFPGAFTTFSTYTPESVRLFADARYAACAANLLLQNGVGLLACGGGVLAAAKLIG